ncbi:MAG: c-type cytochrome [Verrucomicrobia bacterium]|nr:c-type cytochrome [Verrucomicrobiota bacterium]MBI3871222.1 c-type cytochrome [Verrucomicrobiota bacterium]
MHPLRFRVQSVSVILLLWGWAISAAQNADVPALDPAKDLPRVPPTEPDKAVATFQVKPGFEIQLVAAEPLVVDPVAMDFDEDGRLFVVEMRDYSERRDERLGRVRVLEDTDGDGRFDKSWVFAEDLPWPTAVLCYDGGVYVGSTPDLLFLKDTNGDHRADVREVIFTGFAADSLQRLNVQALMNSFRWGIDHRVHGSASMSGGRITSPKRSGLKEISLSGRDFSFDPRTLDFRAETGGGQHGMSFDNAGRKFMCSNSDHLQCALVEDRYLARGAFLDAPAARASIASDGPAAEVYRISPDEPWRVVRTRWRVTGAVPGMVEGGGRPSGYFTGATGATIYRGSAFPSEYLGDAFVADCGSNLIHHKKVRPQGVGFVAERAADEQRSEFVASRDNWFRPVQFANAPDGALYVVDMYREVIEHPWSLPEPIKQHLDLNSGNDRGRIYRIVPKGFQQPARPALGRQSNAQLARLLGHPNGWHRDAASRLLYQRQDAASVAAVERIARDSRSGLGRLHALWTLDGLGALGEDRLAAALADKSPVVREHALRLLEPTASRGALRVATWAALRELARDRDPRVAHQLAWTLNRIHGVGEAAVHKVFLQSQPASAVLTAPMLGALGNAAPDRLVELWPAAGSTTSGNPWLPVLARGVGLRNRPQELSRLRDQFERAPPSRLSLQWLAALASGLSRAGASLGAWDPESKLSSHYVLAQRFVQNTARGQSDRLDLEAGLGLLGYILTPSRLEALAGALTKSSDESIQQAILGAMSRSSERETALALLENWAHLTGGARKDALQILLRRNAWIPLVMESVEAGRIPRTELSQDQVQKLRGGPDAALRNRAVALWGAAPSENRQEVVNRFLPALSEDGNKDRGKRLYEERCMICHRVGNRGGAVGPDLESVRSMGKEKLLTQILDPNREVAPNYMAYDLETISGESVTGLMSFETAEQVRLKLAGGAESSFPRSQIRRLRAAGRSLMPEGLEQGLAPRDVADLLEFISPGPTR